MAFHGIVPLLSDLRLMYSSMVSPRNSTFTCNLPQFVCDPELAHSVLELVVYMRRSLGTAGPERYSIPVHRAGNVRGYYRTYISIAEEMTVSPKVAMIATPAKRLQEDKTTCNKSASMRKQEASRVTPGRQFN